MTNKQTFIYNFINQSENKERTVREVIDYCKMNFLQFESKCIYISVSNVYTEMIRHKILKRKGKILKINNSKTEKTLL